MRANETKSCALALIPSIVALGLLQGCGSSSDDPSSPPTAEIGRIQVLTTVMTGLDNPRGLAFGPDGALYVTEAGRGGTSPCTVAGTGETRCFGLTGAISRLRAGQQTRVVSGLESHALPDGSSASGPTDISFQGSSNAVVTMGLGGDRNFQKALGGTVSGTLMEMDASGNLLVVADILKHEEVANPAGGPIDTNPYAVLAETGGRIIVDAGGNALLRVAANGAIETLAVFPAQANPLFPTLGPPTVESVPTTVARGPDGALYVGELTGFPFPRGLARIFRVAAGQSPVAVCTGFKTIIDIAFAPDGSLLVVENATNAFPPAPPFASYTGRLSRLNLNDCSRTTVIDGLDRPTSVAVGPDGAIYVTNFGVTPRAGVVLRFL